jgi:hypothetical protein
VSTEIFFSMLSDICHIFIVKSYPHTSTIIFNNFKTIINFGLKIEQLPYCDFLILITITLEKAVVLVSKETATFFLHNSYLYHKARKCYFASASTVCGEEAALVRALAKHFLAV